MGTFFNRRKSNDRSSQVILSDKGIDSESGKLAVKNEGTITVIKIITALICVFIGVYLIYRGITTSEYSIIIQFSTSSSIKFTDTPGGIVLLVISIFLLWRTRQNVKIGT
jgi:hypothetical protein